MLAAPAIAEAVREEAPAEADAKPEVAEARPPAVPVAEVLVNDPGPEMVPAPLVADSQRSAKSVEATY